MDERDRITSFKGRTIDLTKPVLVYRNLHSKKVKYSIMQGNLVVGHTDALSMVKCKFVVRKAGKEKALKTGVRNVHAFIKGFIGIKGTMGTCAVRAEKLENPLPIKVRYSPFENLGFHHVWNSKTISLKGANGLVIVPKGVYAAYTF